MTTQRIEIAYGKGTTPVDVPIDNLRGVLTLRSWQGLPDPTGAVENALTNPIGSPPLAEIAYGRSDAVVVISDVTRPVPNKVILPPILRTLEESGIPREAITILIATGMHRPNEGEELIGMVGSEIVENYRIVNHKGDELDSHVDMGVSEDGVPLLVDRTYCDADLKIVTGLIEPHIMAGYSGGRKGVLPGVCSLETMKVMHGYRMIQNPLTSTGRLDDNPFHLTALALTRKVGVDFLLNVTINEEREITGVFAGDLDLAHRAGVKELDQYVLVELDEPVDIVVTGSGGYPLDRTFYQCIKGMVTSKNILKPGGTIVFASHLDEGMGSPAFRGLVEEMTSPENFLESIAEPDYRERDQWMLHDLCNVLLHPADVFLYTEHLEDEWLTKASVQPIRSMNEGLERAFEKHGEQASVAAVPDGPYVMVKVAEPLGA